MNKLNFSIYLMVITFFYSCSSSIKLNEYSIKNINKAKFIPSKEIMRGKKVPKVIIININNNKLKIAKRSNLGSSMSTIIKSGLSRAKSTKIIQRMYSGSSSNYRLILKKEIKAAELAKEIGSDVGQADYVISGKISNATYNHSYIEGYNYIVKTKKGIIHKYIPPKVDYESCVSGSIDILSLPELDIVENIRFDKCAYTSSQVGSVRDIKKSNDSLVREAGSSAMRIANFKIKDFFSKKGYIYELRAKDDKQIIKTTLGYKYGAKQDKEVFIFKIKKVDNALLGTSTKSDVKIGEGVISNQIGADYSWIIIDELEEDVNLGDFIKIKYEAGFFDKL